MLMRRRVGRGGLLGAAATTAVVAGTATAVSGRVQRRQAARYEDSAQAQAYEQQQAAPPPVAAPAPVAAPEDDLVAKLTQLGQLKDQGMLSDEEFAAAKAQLLG